MNGTTASADHHNGSAGFVEKQRGEVVVERTARADAAHVVLGFGAAPDVVEQNTPNLTCHGAVAEMRGMRPRRGCCTTYLRKGVQDARQRRRQVELLLRRSAFVRKSATRLEPIHQCVHLDDVADGITLAGRVSLDDMAWVRGRASVASVFLRRPA